VKIISNAIYGSTLLFLAAAFALPQSEPPRIRMEKGTGSSSSKVSRFSFWEANSAILRLVLPQKQIL